MRRLIDGDALNKIKFHPLPYTHITPSDVDAESYERGWNDAVDAIMSEAETVEPEQKTGRWIDGQCSNCGCDIPAYIIDWKWQKDMDANYCPNCGARMEGDAE